MHSMIAIGESNQIQGLNENNIMPCWYHTRHWCKQYPEGTSVNANNITILQLRENHRPAKDMKLCPGFSGPRKGVRPVINKRHMSIMEIAIEKSKGEGDGQDCPETQLQGKTLEGKAITKLAKVKSKSPPRKGMKEVKKTAKEKKRLCVGPSLQ